MVEVLGHVSEGFVAELTFVKRVCGVRLPARHKDGKVKETRKESKACISLSLLVLQTFTCA